MRFAICDDEPFMAQEIAGRLSRYMEEKHVTSYSASSFSNGRSLLESDCNFEPNVKTKLQKVLKNF